MVAPSQIGVQSGGEHFRDYTHRRACSMNPSHESGMHVAGGKRQDVAREFFVNFGQIRRPARQLATEMLADVWRDRLPDRTIPNIFEVVQNVIEHPVRLAPERGPIGGIERHTGIAHCFSAWFPGGPSSSVKIGFNASAQTW